MTAIEKDLRKSKSGMPRAARYDAANNFGYYLLKNVSIIYVTYQIKMLSYLAFKEKKRLIIRLPETCSLSDEFVEYRERLKHKDGRHVIEVVRFT